MNLITPSVLNSYLYFKKDTSENASQNFLDTLNRVFKTNEYIEKGESYELGLMNGTIKDEFSPIVKDGLWQVVLKKNIKINNTDFLLYGRADVIKEDYIYDIKRTSSYNLLKFQSSMQHRLYMYISGIHNFKYLINENDNFRYIEEYQYTNNTENEIINCISEFMDLINSFEEYKNAYFNNFNKF